MFIDKGNFLEKFPLFGKYLKTYGSKKIDLAIIVDLLKAYDYTDVRFWNTRVDSFGVVEIGIKATANNGEQHIWSCHLIGDSDDLYLYCR
jgi:hypothetical protein